MIITAAPEIQNCYEIFRIIFDVRIFQFFNCRKPVIPGWWAQIFYKCFSVLLNPGFPVIVNLE